MNELIYETYSETIRQSPQNYLIAYKKDNRWIVDPDMQADEDLCIKVFLERFNHSSLYGSGEFLIKKLGGRVVQSKNKTESKLKKLIQTEVRKLLK